MERSLTDKEIGLLLALVRKEAAYHGYGSLYFSDDRSNWPNRLKVMARIASKLQEMRR